MHRVEQVLSRAPGLQGEAVNEFVRLVHVRRESLVGDAGICVLQEVEVDWETDVRCTPGDQVGIVGLPLGRISQFISNQRCIYTFD